MRSTCRTKLHLHLNEPSARYPRYIGISYTRHIELAGVL